MSAGLSGDLRADLRNDRAMVCFGVLPMGRAGVALPFDPGNPIAFGDVPAFDFV